MNSIIWGALNNTPPRRQAEAVIIIYINGEGRVILIYPVKFYPPGIATSRGGICSFLLINNMIKGVDDVAITTQKRKRKKMCW